MKWNCNIQLRSLQEYPTILISDSAQLLQATKELKHCKDGLDGWMMVKETKRPNFVVLLLSITSSIIIISSTIRIDISSITI